MVEQELLSFVAGLQGKASTNAYYGRALLEKNPTLMEDLIYFNKHGFWSLLVGVPAFLQPELQKRRRRILEAMAGQAFGRRAGEDGPSPFIQALIEKLPQWGMTRAGVSSEMMSIFQG